MVCCDIKFYQGYKYSWPPAPSEKLNASRRFQGEEVKERTITLYRKTYAADVQRAKKRKKQLNKRLPVPFISFLTYGDAGS
jgi:hypothetical protein